MIIRKTGSAVAMLLAGLLVLSAQPALAVSD
jgi:hypothetical protein